MSPLSNEIIAFSIDTISQEALADIMRTVDILNLCYHSSDQTMLHFAISLPCLPDKKITIINLLLNEATQRSALTVDYLFTTTDHQSKSPYYQALETADMRVAKLIDAWLTATVSHRHISIRAYFNMHFMKNAEGEHPLHAVAKLRDSRRFTMGFSNIETAYKKNWLALDMIRHLLTEPNIRGERLLDVTIRSACNQTVASMLQYCGASALTEDKSGYTALHALTYEDNAPALAVCFIEIHRAIETGFLTPEGYPSLFLKRINHSADFFNLLRISLKRSSGSTSQVILAHAEQAEKNGWLDASSYRYFLLQHPSRKKGFSYLHESLRSTHYLNVYAYVSACLRAILKQKISLADFKKILLEENAVGYPVFHQAINNEFLETAELFLNIFHMLFSYEDYQYHAFYRKNTPQTTGQKHYLARATNDKPCYKEINALLTCEKYRIKSEPKTEDLIFYQKVGRVPSRALREIVGLLQQVAQYQQVLPPPNASMNMTLTPRNYHPRYFSSSTTNTTTDRSSIQKPTQFPDSFRLF